MEVRKDFTQEQLGSIAEMIVRDNPRARILAFYGKMGVGKTTLIKALCEYFKVTDIVGSPTFSIVNQYLSKNSNTLFHFDFYRLKKLEEAYDIGYEDYFYNGNYCFIEWPEKIESLLPEDCLRIYLEEQDGLRNIRYEKQS
ncbi:MAG: tRNA (adenosine(37)-N6)-threonylcarbamoyltransferase complex ATPase subunit type 1 TsaE [Bacteroidetes bacterium]|nr:MAG: tRNA (adenosine(37)-N6)-threonylcarbamoyltransferase complex ATPase subunit type 1 TsaE [Bacteroidota bacterium]